MKFARIAAIMIPLAAVAYLGGEHIQEASAPDRRLISVVAFNMIGFEDQGTHVFGNSVIVAWVSEPRAN